MLTISTEVEESGKVLKGQKKKSLKSYLLEKMRIWINGPLEAERDEFLARGRQVRLREGEDNWRG